MFERGPAFEPKTGFPGSDSSPLIRRNGTRWRAGFFSTLNAFKARLLHWKYSTAAGACIYLASGHNGGVKSHGTYKLIFNAIYDSPSMVRPSSIPKPSEQKQADAATAPTESWRAATSRVHSDLAALLRQNQTFFSAKGPQAVEERSKLFAAVDQMEKERIPDVQDSGTGLNEPARRKSGRVCPATAPARGRPEEQGIRGFFDFGWTLGTIQANGNRAGDQRGSISGKVAQNRFKHCR